MSRWCGRCQGQIDWMATKCPHCTADIVYPGDYKKDSETVTMVFVIGLMLWAAFWVAGKIYDFFGWLIHLII